MLKLNIQFQLRSDRDILPVIMKVLITRFSSIGDIVLTTPIIRAVKTQMPKSELHFATKPQYADIVRNNPYVDKVHELNGSLNQLIQDLKKEKFDLKFLHANET